MLEAKQVSETHESSRWDKAMLRAAAQADTYIRALPSKETKDKIRYLRPDYQAPEESAEQGELATERAEAPHSRRPEPDPGPAKKLPWPKTLQAQIRAVRDQLTTGPMDAPTLATRFKRKPEKSVAQVLDALTDLGMVGSGKHGNSRIREG